MGAEGGIVKSGCGIIRWTPSSLPPEMVRAFRVRLGAPQEFTLNPRAN